MRTPIAPLIASRSPSPQRRPTELVYNTGARPNGKIIAPSCTRKSILGCKLLKKSIKYIKILIFKYKPARVLPNEKRIKDLSELIYIFN